MSVEVCADYTNYVVESNDSNNCRTATWSYPTFGGLDWDWGSSVQQTSDGGYIIAGGTNSFGAGGGDAWLIKTDSEGNEIWNKTFGGLDLDAGGSVQQTSDGGYIVASMTTSFGAAGSGDVWLIKINSDGDELWNKTFGGLDWEKSSSIRQTSDDGYIVAGTSFGADGSGDVWLIKTNFDGDELWNKTFGGSDEDLGWAVQQTSDGGYIIASRTGSYETEDFDVWLIKTDSEGNELWNRTFGGSEWDQGSSIQQTADGGYIIAGSTKSFSVGDFDVWLIKTDSEGDELQNNTFGGSGRDYGYSVQQTTDGGYIIVGETFSFGAGSGDVWLIKVSPIEPDLMITNVWNENSTIYYKIINKGDITAGASSTSLTVDGVFRASDSVASLESGVYRTESFNYTWNCTNISDTIEVCADHRDGVVEGDETNNCRTETLLCKPPDIRVNQTSFDMRLPPDVVSNCILIIGNDGTGALEFNVSDATASHVVSQIGWPKTTDYGVESSPALGDIDGDGDIEVVVASYYDKKVYAWHHDGSNVTGWPKTTGSWVSSSPALGDIDGDGDTEVVVGSHDDKVYAWHHDGSTVTGWPKTTGHDVESSPALGDIDGDGDIEVVVGSDDDKVYAWHHDGSTVSGWPKTISYSKYSNVYSSPALGDIDGDGDIEVVVGSYDDKVHIWDCSGIYNPNNIEWGTFHHNIRRTGLYEAMPSKKIDWLSEYPTTGTVDPNRHHRNTQHNRSRLWRISCKHHHHQQRP